MSELFKPEIIESGDFFIGQLSNGVKDLFIVETDPPLKKVCFHNNFDDVLIDYHWHMKSGVLVVNLVKPVQPIEKTGAIV
jgi:hypothetical protein